MRNLRIYCQWQNCGRGTLVSVRLFAEVPWKERERRTGVRYFIVSSAHCHSLGAVAGVTDFCVSNSVKYLEVG